MRAILAKVIVGLLAAVVSTSVCASETAASKSKSAKPLPNVRSATVAEGILAVQSKHFYVVTDMKLEETQELLSRLETMLVLVSNYWGKNPGNVVIPCLVFKNMKAWPPHLMSQLPPDGVQSVAEGGGVTLSTSLTFGGKSVPGRSVVFAPAEHGTPQHESVHAFCHLAFGTTGPTWYSEGMAELGNYWNPDEPSINADPRIIEFLRTEKPRKRVTEVLAPFQATGDCWQNYAWRWALCHLLVNNSNYSAAFRKLGLKFLEKGRFDINSNAREQFWYKDFTDTFGGVIKEMEFEYDFLIDHLAVGLRSDLCAWDWKSRFAPLRSGAKKVAVKAARGWQPTSVSVKAGETFDYSANGTWKLGKEEEAVSAGGGPKGRGRLVATLMKDNQLGLAFPLGESGAFTASDDGSLYLRCNDSWIELADNSGSIAVEIRPAGKEKVK